MKDLNEILIISELRFYYNITHTAPNSIITKETILFFLHFTKSHIILIIKT